MADADTDPGDYISTTGSHDAAISCTIPETLDNMADRTAMEAPRLPQGCLRFINPHRYKVSISWKLNNLRNGLIDQVRKGE